MASVDASLSFCRAFPFHLGSYLLRDFAVSRTKSVRMRLAPIDPSLNAPVAHIRNSPLFTLPPMFATTGATN